MIKQEDLDSGKVVINSHGTFWFTEDLHKDSARVFSDGYPIIQHLHRLDGPAVEWNTGCKEWWINGGSYEYSEFLEEVNKLNRKAPDMIKQEDLDSGKVVINSYGEFHFKSPGVNVLKSGWPIFENLHRENDLPAVVWKSGAKYWYENGKMHRIGGTAQEWSDGTQYWYIHGKQYTKEEYDKEVNKLNRKATNMITMKEWLELANYEITNGEKYLWDCYGPYAFVLDSADLQGDTKCNSSIVFDLVSQEVYEVNVHDFAKGNAYRLITENKREAFNAEAVDRRLLAKQAWDDVSYVDLELLSDFMEKANAIKNGDEYDTTVSIPIDIPDELLLHCMKQAHEKNMTFNDWMVKELTLFTNRVVAGRITEENAKAWLET